MSVRLATARSPTPTTAMSNRSAPHRRAKASKADDDQQDARRAPARAGRTHPRPRPSVRAGRRCRRRPPCRARRQPGEHDRQQQAERPSRRPAGCRLIAAVTSASAQIAEHIGHDQDVPEAARAPGAAAGRRCASPAAPAGRPDQARDRLAALPDEPEQQRDEDQRCASAPSRLARSGSRPSPRSSSIVRKASDHESEDADHPPVQQPGGGVVDRQQPQAAAPRREQAREITSAETDRDDRGEVGEHGQPGRLVALPEHEEGADRGQREDQDPESSSRTRSARSRRRRRSSPGAPPPTWRRTSPSSAPNSHSAARRARPSARSRARSRAGRPGRARRSAGRRKTRHARQLRHRGQHRGASARAPHRPAVDHRHHHVGLGGVALAICRSNSPAAARAPGCR